MLLVHAGDREDTYQEIDILVIISILSILIPSITLSIIGDGLPVTGRTLQGD